MVAKFTLPLAFCGSEEHIMNNYSFGANTTWHVCVIFCCINKPISHKAFMGSMKSTFAWFTLLGKYQQVPVQQLCYGRGVVWLSAGGADGSPEPDYLIRG